MPETDPRTPDPLKRDAAGGAHTSGAHTGRDAAGRDYSATATDADAGSPSEAPPVAPPAAPSAGPSAASEQPALRSEGRAAGSKGAHSKAGPSKPAKESKAHSPLYLWIKEVATVVAIAVVLSFLIKTFLFRAFYIPSESMVSTLDVNDRIFVNLLVPEPFALEHGDVVVFKDTKGWLVPTPDKADGPFTWVQDGLTFVGLLPDNSEQHLVKRVIGLPGDHVVCCDAGGKLTINGKEVDETYVNPAEVPDIRNFDVVVPDGKIWVMGDNRNHSADSRAHQDSNGGFIDMPDIEGKAAVIAWPLNRLTGLGNYPDVFRNVPAPTGK
ncbi:signal peptidase I [Arthrobacter sp. Y81]|uniref:signal peptidase I n=1 Tax=Arthrobacter sp. Y81 TaxID=2058897 RepID=UPI00215703D5|nr:signal peptidase I [Arthrobacter sp. Y81]